MRPGTGGTTNDAVPSSGDCAELIYFFACYSEKYATHPK